MPDTQDYGRSSPFNYREGEWLNSAPEPDDVVSGQETMKRVSVITNNLSVATQSMRLTYFTATKDKTVTRVEISSGGVAAAATPTLIRMGLYTVDFNGDLTLVASTPNDTTLFASTVTLYNKSFSSPYTMVKGQRYAFGVLVVSTVATPTFYGHASTPVAFMQYNPKLSASLSGQADLPVSVLNINLTVNNQIFYAALLA